jgi:hypothetical protein
MTGRPEWWKPGMSEAETAIWEAAQRTADAAPELAPGDDVHMQIRQLLGGCLATPAHEERGAA